MWIVNNRSRSMIPEEILRMDKRSIELYKEVLQVEHESVHNIRVMVVGHYGVGKTTLTKRLFKEDININKQESTNGIDVHIRKCKVSLENGEWKMLDTGQKPIHYRLVKLLTKKRLDKKCPEEEDVPISTEVKCTGSDYTVYQETDSWDAPEVFEKPISSTLDSEMSFRNQLWDLIKEQSQLPTDGKDTNTADLSVWDFAGQYAFYATHQVFLSRRAVYLLVTDMSKHMEDIVKDDHCFPDSDGAKSWRISEFVEFWLKSIHEFCSSSDDQGPPVLFVGTFADKLNQ
ncbi:probable serine/threonine-protein kinase roco5, partial [Mercenaria mercenaria]|uniref:probable serine/threonine-protein kinase roco5 n=1 Tax=Mercenaria mercenaria TaxID=6596 RepID=UPI00234EAC2C